jgi:hypothetical protein
MSAGQRSRSDLPAAHPCLVCLHRSVSAPLLPRRPIGRIAFGLIEALTIRATMQPREALEAALVVGTRIERHNRVWRMGPWHHEGLAIVGRIGYESAGVNELWDDELQDFKESMRPLGLTSPFAIDGSKLRVAFQLRGRDIRVNSFTGALQALMNEASPTDRWRVRRELRQVSFDTWATTVDRVTLVHATLERPNPHYGARRRVRELIEDTNARIAELVVRADPSELQGLDIGAPFVREAIEHTSDNYGSLTAVGERGGDEAQWNSKLKGAAEVSRVPADPVTRDVSSNALRHELGDPTAADEMLAEGREAREALEAMGRDIDEIDLFADEEKEEDAV